MTKALIRPAWTPATIALMVIGFMVFWPLGLAMLAYIIRRLALIIPTLFGIMVINFIVVQAAQ